MQSYVESKADVWQKMGLQLMLQNPPGHSEKINIDVLTSKNWVKCKYCANVSNY